MQDSAVAARFDIGPINLKAELDREQGDFFGTMPTPAGGETEKWYVKACVRLLLCRR